MRPTGLFALSAIPAAVLAVLASIPASAAAAASSRSPACMSVDHWGQYFGDDTNRDGGATRTPTPLAIPDPTACVIELGTSNSTQYALMSDGTLWAWGQGTRAELGDGQTVNSFTSAVQVKFPSGVSIASIPGDAMPFDTGLAIDTRGNLWGWGLNKRGELCTGTKSLYTTPVELTAFAAPVTFVAGAANHLIADADGVIESCGADSYGVLGNGVPSGLVIKSPVEVNTIGGDGGEVAELTSSFISAGVLLTNGTYYDWGYNASGQVGNGGTKPVDAPYRVVIPDSSPALDVSQGGSDAGNSQVLALLADGSTWAWGNNHWDQLGIGAAANQELPVQFQPPAGVTYIKVVSGGQTSYALDSAGNVWAWGDGSRWQVGDGSMAIQPLPDEVDSGVTFLSSTAYDVAAGM